METSTWCLMEAVSGQTGIAVSCIQHIIPVYLKTNTIRILTTRIYNFFLSLDVIDIFKNCIHTFLVSFQMKEKVNATS